ncbi:hydrolase [Oceanobacillus saliphilus]|uniref:hydrolase n=1 Tax=Oceanobacillus saliphilus TaxID=2925834 RepID=UPI00201D6B9B|nr:hydrolase [Oceanobacillus saliphilus]
MEKEKYYVNIGDGSISQMRYQNNDDFVIYASMQDIALLRSKMENMHGANFDSYIRAHIPIVPYHNDSANDEYDDNLTEAFRMVYELGDEQTKSHIKSMGILSDKHL